ncbi:5'/3'-nucleotidase SurE [Marinimicrobium locisalis]|uniref:5'/3'-nucleotidase SurE n=1 Tax=Marinimicrobium locisalis TaxID=546022 RepID=UPI0032214277
MVEDYLNSVLVCNDDGFHSPSLRPLLRYLESMFRHVVAVVPDSDRSGVACSMTVDRPIRVKQPEDGIYTVNGTPVDCVNFAVSELFEGEDLDMLISGINAGHNMANSLLYSGTVGAALHAQQFGIRGICFSANDEDPNWVENSLSQIMRHDLVKGFVDPAQCQAKILNINLPAFETSAEQQVRITRPAQRQGIKMTAAVDPYGNAVYWAGKPGDIVESNTLSDYNVLQSGDVSVTPIDADLSIEMN